MHPVVATIAVLFRNDEVLLVRRANPPDAGRWGFPGGKMELGETIEAADDALDAAFVPMATLGSSDLALSLDVEEIAREAYTLLRNQKRTVPGAKTQMKQLKLNRGFRAEPGRG